MSAASAELEPGNGLVVPDVLELSEINLAELMEVKGTREGGLFDGWVPMSLIDHEEVPVEEGWAQELADKMKQTALVRKGNGQLSAIVLGLIPGQKKLKIIDGFHREAAIRINGGEAIYAHVNLTDWNELYDNRIFTAKDHAHVRFSRVVQWMREVWQHSGLSDKLTVEQAVLLYRFDSSGSRLGLDPLDAEAAKAWVKNKEGQWHMASMTIHSHLKIAEAVDPKLVHSTRERLSGRTLQAPTQSILRIFSKELPNDFVLQNLVMDTAKQQSLKGPEVTALCVLVRSAADVESAQKLISQIDWETWEPVYGESKQKELRRAHDPRHRGARVLDLASKDVSSVIARVELSSDRGEVVTKEMVIKIDEARLAAGKLMTDMGKLIVMLSAQASRVEVVEAKSLPQKPAALPKPSLAQRRDNPTRPPAEPQAKILASVTRPKEGLVSASKSKTPITDRLIRNHSSATRPSPVLAEQRPETVRQESSVAVGFKNQLRDFLNQKTDEMPEIVNFQHMAWAQAVLLEASFSGDLSLRDDVREVMDSARKDMGASRSL